VRQAETDLGRHDLARLLRTDRYLERRPAIPPLGFWPAEPPPPGPLSEAEQYLNVARSSVA